ncbi:MAG TPA: type II toxin-antitoxin system VapC family toxin [Thermoanaerobaculia bacterium]|jgi:predicted nucleic-acid-binding protein|nr:type II toxin-antitoxin system VapC family toxin [Thermoanaerobaculia bacterium]
MRAVDTNVLVRLVSGDDPAQVAAAEEYVASGAWVSHVVLVECVWVLKSVYSVPHPQLVAAIEPLLDHEALVIQEPDVVAAALAIFREHPKVQFSDCMVLEIARKAGHVPLGTFDRTLAKQSGAERI